MESTDLKNKIINAYRIEKYAELALLLLFLDENENDFRSLAAKLVLESENQKDMIENILIKMGLGDYINIKINPSYTKGTISKLNKSKLLITLLNNEILAMNNYLELFLTTSKEMIKDYFENEDEYFKTFKEMSYEEFDHARRILNYIYGIDESFH